MALVEGLLTAEQYRCWPDHKRPTELVRGRVVEMHVPAPRHGYYCGNVVALLHPYAKAHRLGRVMSNDSGVVTEREPDTVRRADVIFFSFARLPEGPLPDGYLDAVPEVIFEVRSPTDRWSKITRKVAEYLDAGVVAVCVLDPQTEALTVYRDDEFPRVLTAEEEFSLPGVLGGFRVLVRQFFE